MGTVALKTASGGSVILSPTNTAVDTTITVPASNATMLTTATSGVPINGPAGCIYYSTATAAPTTPTKLTGFITDVNYGSIVDSANSRLLIPAGGAGVYQVGYAVGASLTSDAVLGFLAKNGTMIQNGTAAAATGFGITSVGTFLINLVAGDYLELWAQRGGTVCNINAGRNTFLSAVLVRSAI